MDFHSLKRNQLQSLCKKHGIPANQTNRQMADLLAAALNVKGKSNLKEDRSEAVSEDEQKLSKKVRFSPEVETREYEPSGYKRPVRMTRGASKLANSTLEESENNVISDEVGNKRGRNGRTGRISRTSRSQAKEVSTVTESETETGHLADAITKTMAGEVGNGGRRSLRNRTVFTEAVETNGVHTLKRSEAKKGARRSTRNGTKATDPELACDEVANVDGGEAGKGARRSARNAAKNTNPDCGQFRKDARRSTRNGAKCIDSEPANDGVVVKAGGESRKCARQSARNLAKRTDSELVNDDMVKARKDARQSARIGANSANCEPVKDEVNQITRSKAHSVLSLTTAERKGGLGAAVKESSKGIGRAASKRKSVVQHDDTWETRQTVPNESLKRKKNITILDEVTEVSGYTETTDELKKAQPPMVNPRKSRRKTVVLNSNIIAEELAIENAMGKEEHKGKELRRSTRRASMHVGEAMSDKANEIAEVKEVSQSVNMDTSAIVSDLLAVKPPRASARYASKMKTKTTETALPVNSLSGADTEMAISEAAGGNEIAKKKENIKGKCRRKTKIDPVDVPAVNSAIGSDIDCTTNLVETVASTLASGSKDEDKLKVVGESVAVNEAIVLNTGTIISDSSIKGTEDEQCQSSDDLIDPVHIKETFDIAEGSDNANEGIVTIEGSASDQCHSSQKCLNLVNEEKTLKEVAYENNIEGDADRQCGSYENFSNSDGVEVAMKVASGSAISNKSIALDTGSLFSSSCIQYGSEDQCRLSMKSAYSGIEQETLKVAAKSVANNEDSVPATGNVYGGHQGYEDAEHRSAEQKASPNNDTLADTGNLILNGGVQSFAIDQCKSSEKCSSVDNNCPINQSAFGCQSSIFSGLKKMFAEEKTPSMRDLNNGTHDRNGHSEEYDGINILERFENTEDETENNSTPEKGVPLQSVNLEIVTESIEDPIQGNDGVNEFSTEVGRPNKGDVAFSFQECNTQGGTLNEEQHEQKVDQCIANLENEEETLKAAVESMVRNEETVHENFASSDNKRLAGTGNSIFEGSILGASHDQYQSAQKYANIDKYSTAELNAEEFQAKELDVATSSAGFSLANQSKYGSQNSSYTGLKRMLAEEETSIGRDSNCESDAFDGHSHEFDGINILERFDNAEDENQNDLMPENGEPLQSVDVETATESMKDLFEETDDVNDCSTEAFRFGEGDEVVSDLEWHQHVVDDEEEHGQEVHQWKASETIMEDAGQMCDGANEHSNEIQRNHVGKASCEVFNGETEKEEVLISDNGCVEEKSGEDANNSTDNPSIGNDGRSHDDVANQLNTIPVNEGELLDSVGFTNELPCEGKNQIQPMETVATFANSKETANIEDVDSVSALEETENFGLNLLFQAEESVVKQPHAEERDEVGAVDQLHAFTATVVNQDAGQNICELKSLPPKEACPHPENDKHGVHCGSSTFPMTKMTSSSGLIPMTPQEVAEPCAMKGHKKAADQMIESLAVGEDTIMVDTDEMGSGANEQSNVVQGNDMKNDSGLQRIENVDSTDEDQLEVETPNWKDGETLHHFEKDDIQNAEGKETLDSGECDSHDLKLSGSNSKAELEDGKGTCQFVQEEKHVNTDQHDIATSIAVTCEETARISNNGDEKNVLEEKQVDTLPPFSMNEANNGQVSNIAALKKFSDGTRAEDLQDNMICAREIGDSNSGEPFLSEASDAPEFTTLPSHKLNKCEDEFLEVHVESELFTDMEINLFSGNRECDQFVHMDLSKGSLIRNDSSEQALQEEKHHLEKGALGLEGDSGCAELRENKNASALRNGQDMHFFKSADAPGDISTLNQDYTEFQDDYLDQSIAMDSPGIQKEQMNISYYGDQDIDENRVLRTKEDCRAAIEKINALEESENGESLPSNNFDEASDEMEGTTLHKTMPGSSILVVNKETETSSSVDPDCGKPEMELHHSITQLNEKTSYDEFDGHMEDDEMIASIDGQMQNCEDDINNTTAYPTAGNDERDHGDIYHEPELEVEDEVVPVANYKPFEGERAKTGDSLSYESDAFELDSFFREDENGAEKPGVEGSPTNLMSLDGKKLPENTISELSPTQENTANNIAQETQQLEKMPEIGATTEDQEEFDGHMEDDEMMASGHMQNCEEDTNNTTAYPTAAKDERDHGDIYHEPELEDEVVHVANSNPFEGKTTDAGDSFSYESDAFELDSFFQENENGAEKPGVEGGKLLENVISELASTQADEPNNLKQENAANLIVQEPQDMQQLEEKPEIGTTLAEFTTLEDQDVTAKDSKICELKMVSPTHTSSHLKTETDKVKSFKRTALSASAVKRSRTGLIQSTPRKVAHVFAMKENASNLKMEHPASLTACRTSQKRRRPLEDLTKP